MREILFRGKCKDNGKWFEGDLYQSRLKSVFYISYYTNFGARISVSVIPETIGQYTGLTDKNGKKIFEGDIVDILTENEEIGVVVYDEGGFLVKADGFCVDFHTNINGTDLEIIGNIQDSPNFWEEGVK